VKASPASNATTPRSRIGRGSFETSQQVSQIGSYPVRDGFSWTCRERAGLWGINFW
jgi:hypothetical protein